MKKWLLLGVLGSAMPVWSAPPSNSPVNLLVASVKWPTIRAGDDWAPTVGAIQYLLRGRGFYKGPIDGVYGTETIAAVKAFQRKNKLQSDGILGPKTLPKLVQTVKIGSRGDAVRAAQLLARNAVGHGGQLPYATLEADGVFGQQTEDAVTWAQTTKNDLEVQLVADGIMGPRSWCLLLGGTVIGSKY